MDNGIYASLLRYCGKEKALRCGRRLHAHMLRHRRLAHPHLANLLLLLYRRCSRPTDVASAFALSPPRLRDSFSWNLLVSAYACSGAHHQDAFRAFSLMRSSGPRPDKCTFLPLLSSCARTCALPDGLATHAAAVDAGLIVAGSGGGAGAGTVEFHSDLAVATALLDMYSKCGQLVRARRVFDHVPRPDRVLWTAMISACAHLGHADEALSLFHRMDSSADNNGFSPDGVAFVAALDACSVTKSLHEGRRVHERILLSPSNALLPVQNALVNMYSKCGSLSDARSIFDGMSLKNVVSWTTMIGAYARCGHPNDALELFWAMVSQGVKPNRVTFLSVLDCCSTLSDGRSIHECVHELGADSDIAMKTALINMYGKCGSLEDALALFERMDLTAIEPDKVTFLCLLNACSSLSSLVNGRTIHQCASAAGFDSDVAVTTAVLNMYAKCGSLHEARAAFDGMRRQDVISCNAMLTAYAQNGLGKEATEIFARMELERLTPDKVSYLCLLNSCSHAGLWDESWEYFISMVVDHGVPPGHEHFVCMIDLLGRAGYLNEANGILENMPLPTDVVAWTTFLGACRSHGDAERGEHAAKRVFELDPRNGAAYVLLSNIYAAAGRWDDVRILRKAMEERGVKKLPGFSWIEVEKSVHGFLAGDTSHPRSEEIYAELWRLSKRMAEVGFVPDTVQVLHDVEDEVKARMLSSHSEKLAVAFGLISTPAGTPLRIVKNLRMCSDCHAAFKLISNIVDREINVRDANRFHHFKQGFCSCGDYW